MTQIGNLGRIPFLLIEDLLENQTVKNANIIWTEMIEPITESLTQPDLFNKGILKIQFGALV